MGVSTQVIIAGDWFNRVFEAREKVMAGIKRYSRDGFNAKIKSVTLPEFTEMLQIVFTVALDTLQPWERVKHQDTSHRVLTVHFSCHDDCKDVYNGKKLLLSLGADDQAVEIMKLILAEFPECDRYLIPNDYSDEYTAYPAMTGTL